MELARAGALLDEGGRAAGLEGLPDFAERVVVEADDLGRLGDVAKYLGQLQQGQIALDAMEQNSRSPG